MKYNFSSEPNIDAFVFDIGDTLINEVSLRYEAVEFSAGELQKRGFIMDVAGFVSAYKEVDENISAPDINHLFSHPLIIEKLIDSYCIKNQPEILMNYLAIHRFFVWGKIKLDKRLIKMFSKIKKLNLKIGILTDGTTLEQYQILEQLGVLKYTDAVVTSEEIGFSKPSQEIFNNLFKRLDMDPKNMLMIGNDIERDINAAKKFGMKTIYIDNNVGDVFNDYPNHTILNYIYKLTNYI